MEGVILRSYLTGGRTNPSDATTLGGMGGEVAEVRQNLKPRFNDKSVLLFSLNKFSLVGVFDLKQSEPITCVLVPCGFYS